MRKKYILHPGEQTASNRAVSFRLCPDQDHMVSSLIPCDSLCTAQPLSQAKGKEETDFISLAGSEAFLCFVTSQVWNTTAHRVKEHCKPHWSQLVLK